MIEPIARIRVELRSVEPHVWRRIDVPLSCTLLALRDIIQIAMGWTDSHLFEFTADASNIPRPTSGTFKWGSPISHAGVAGR